MTGGVIVWPLLRKELRALAPVGLPTAAALLAGALAQSPSLMVLAVSMYLVGTPALGAMAIGHEYAHGTLDLLLAQPIDRRRILLTKLAAIALLLALLVLVLVLTSLLLQALHPSATTASPGRGSGNDLPPLPTLLAPLFLSLCVAPWMTMLGRGSIAGTVFTLTVYMGWAVLIPDLWLSSGASSREAAEPDPWLLAVLCAGSAFAGWRTFRRLEWAGGRSGSLPVPSLFRRSRSEAARPSRRRPVVALLGKELHLQHTTFIVAALYVVAWIVVPYLGYEAYRVESLRGGLRTLFSGLLAVLTGALASAEERAMGTLTWQIVQPYSVRKQWAIKASTAFALTLLLAVALPSLLDALGGGDQPLFGVMRADGTVPTLLNTRPAWTVMVLLVLTAAGMFVSSLSTSSLVAMLITPVLVLATMGAGVSVAQRSERWTSRAFGIGSFRPTDGGMWEQYGDWLVRGWSASKPVAALVLLAVFTLLAFRHHRSSRAGAAIVARQAAWLVTGCSSAGFLIGAFWPALLWVLLTH